MFFAYNIETSFHQLLPGGSPLFQLYPSFQRTLHFFKLQAWYNSFPNTTLNFSCCNFSVATATVVARHVAITANSWQICCFPKVKTKTKNCNISEKNKKYEWNPQLQSQWARYVFECIHSLHPAIFSGKWKSGNRYGLWHAFNIDINALCVFQYSMTFFFYFSDFSLCQRNNQ